MADILASVSVVLGAEVSGFKAAMADARRELKGLVQFSEGMRDIGRNLTSYVSAPIALLGVGAVAASAKLESLKNGLQAIAQQELGKQGITGLVGVQVAAQQTGERLKELQVLAKAPGLGLETAEQADIRLRAVGTSASESAKEIKAFANAIATTGGGRTEFQTVTTQLAQMTAKGKVLAQDLRPIIEAAPAVAAALQTLYGTVDSEDISKALAKQGQSSKDFVRVLTEELGKLPQVTGGLKAIYENDLDALLVASAKVGDGIAKAFNLQAVGEKVGNTITALGDGFANLSQPAQTLIVSLAGLAAATGPVLLGLGTLGVALPSIKAGFVAVQSGIELLKGGLVALINPTTLLVAGLVAVAAGAYYLATSSQRTLAAYREQSAATRQLTTDISPLLDRYDELKAKSQLTANEQAELKAIVEKVTAVLPAAGQGMDGYGNYLELATGKARDFIKANQNLERAIAIQSLPDQKKKLNELAQAYAFLLDERDQITRKGSFNGVSVDDLGTRFLVDFRQELARTATELEKQKQLVAELGGTVNGISQRYRDFQQTHAAFWAEFNKHNGDLTKQTGLLADLREQLKKVKEAREGEGTEAAIFADNQRIKSLQAEIDRLEGTDKASKKATDALKKLREELARLGALDGLLGNVPTQMEVLERRATTLENGLKTLIEAGVSPTSRAFRGFVEEAARANLALDKLRASSQLDFKQTEVKSPVKVTIGDSLPEDVARTLGELAKQVKPFELPVRVKLDMQQTLSAPGTLQILNAELLKIGEGYRLANGAAQLFGNSFDDLGAKADLMRTALQNLLAQGISPLTPGMQQMAEQYKELAAQSLRVQEVSGVLKSGIMEMAAGIGDAFATISSGTGDFGDALTQTLLSTVGSMATQLGQILLASGLGIESLKAGLAAFSGVGAIAAGIGLIAIGGLAKGAAASLAKGSSGASSASSASNYGQKSSGAQTVKVVGEFVLRNKTLVAAVRSDDYRSSATD